MADLSQDHIVQGLKDALAKGLRRAIARLGNEGGFLTKLNVKLPMPEQLRKVESALRAMNQDKLADDFVVTMNRAAEQAVPEAGSVFADTLRQMTIEDAKSILNGPDDAARHVVVFSLLAVVSANAQLTITYDYYCRFSDGQWFFFGPQTTHLWGGPLPLSNINNNYHHYGNPPESNAPGTEAVLVNGLMNGVRFLWGRCYRVNLMDLAIAKDCGVALSPPPHLRRARACGHARPGTRKVVRGGSFFDPPARSRGAFRLAYPSWQRVLNVGFRVVTGDAAAVADERRIDGRGDAGG